MLTEKLDEKSILRRIGSHVVVAGTGIFKFVLYRGQKYVSYSGGLEYVGEFRSMEDIENYLGVKKRK